MSGTSFIGVPFLDGARRGWPRTCSVQTGVRLPPRVVSEREASRLAPRWGRPVGPGRSIRTAGRLSRYWPEAQARPVQRPLHGAGPVQAGRRENVAPGDVRTESEHRCFQAAQSAHRELVPDAENPVVRSPPTGQYARSWRDATLLGGGNGMRKAERRSSGLQALGPTRSALAVCGAGLRNLALIGAVSSVGGAVTVAPCRATAFILGKTTTGSPGCRWLPLLASAPDCRRYTLLVWPPYSCWRGRPCNSVATWLR